MTNYRFTIEFLSKGVAPHWEMFEGHCLADTISEAAGIVDDFAAYDLLGIVDFRVWRQGPNIAPDQMDATALVKAILVDIFADRWQHSGSWPDFLDGLAPDDIAEAIAADQAADMRYQLNKEGA